MVIVLSNIYTIFEGQLTKTCRNTEAELKKKYIKKCVLFLRPNQHLSVRIQQYQQKNRGTRCHSSVFITNMNLLDTLF